MFASAAGGSGGMLIDLGYAVRRVLARMTTAEAHVTAFVYASAPTDPNTTDRELANLYAGITELNHYADPDVTFTAHYGGPEGPKVEGRGLPFSATYLLPMPERSSGAFRDCISHLAGYVAHDLTTPLGHALEQIRNKPTGFGKSPFRTFGTYGVWFPRGLLLAGGRAEDLPQAPPNLAHRRTSPPTAPASTSSCTASPTTRGSAPTRSRVRLKAKRSAASKAVPPTRSNAGSTAWKVR